MGHVGHRGVIWDMSHITPHYPHTVLHYVIVWGYMGHVPYNPMQACPILPHHMKSSLNSCFVCLFIER
mgnify:CR=1 FL=1